MRRPGPLGWALSLLALMNAPETAPARQVPPLRIEEVASWVVPEAVPVRGISVLPDGTVLLWSDSDVLVLDATFERVHRIQIRGVDGIRAVGATPAGDVLLLSDPLQVVAVAADGTSTVVVGTECGGRVVSAAYRHPVWYVLADPEDAPHRRLLAIDLGAAGTGTATCRVVSHPQVSGIVGSTPHGVLLTELLHPFSVTQFTHDGAISTFVPDLPAETPTAPDPDTEHRWEGWVSQPALVIDRGTLQVLSDLRSDARLLIRYDEGGATVARRFVQVPLGLIHADTATRRITGIRRLNRTEIVRYKWTWGEGR